MTSPSPPASAPSSDSAAAAAEPGSLPSPYREPLDEEGRERPAFVRDFPVDPQLELLIEGFCRGNFRAVRQGAVQLGQTAPDPAVRAAALELLRRTKPDPVVKILLALAAAWFAWIVAWAYSGTHP